MRTFFSHRSFLLFFRHFSTSSTALSPHIILRSYHFSSCPNFSSSAPFLRRQHEEDVMVSVWWNTDTCMLPVGFDLIELAPTLCAALHVNGIKGHVHQINAFGHGKLLSRHNRMDLQWSRTGINFKAAPGGGIYLNYADHFLVRDVLNWREKNTPPAHLFFVGAPPSLVDLLHELRFRNFNILLATNNAPAELGVAATIWWDWKSLISGKELAGHHFNPPPDGFSDSVYGHFEEAAIEDPFSFSTSTLRSKIRRVGTKDILKLIQHILKSDPDEEMAIEDLRSELVDVTKKYYGSENFLRMITQGLYAKHLVVGSTFEDEVAVRLINL